MFIIYNRSQIIILVFKMLVFIFYYGFSYLCLKAGVWDKGKTQKHIHK